MSRTNSVNVLQRRIPISASTVLTFAWLIGIGLTIPFAHEILFKTGFAIPGHHLEWMALVVIGRLTSKNKWAGTITGGTAAATSPALYNVNPIVSATYLAVGVVFDILYYLTREPQGVITIGIIAGMAHLTKPIIRMLVDALSGIPYRPLLLSTWFPFFTFLVFGFAGGAIGAAFIKTGEMITDRLRKRKKRSIAAG